MKVRDESDWQRQLADFANDPEPMAVVLQNFLITWANYAETWLQEAHGEGIYDDDITPMEGLRATLEITQEHAGRISIGFTGAALTLLAMHWIHGEGLYDDMNSIERTLVEDAAQVKIDHLKAQAQAVGSV